MWNLNMCSNENNNSIQLVLVSNPDQVKVINENKWQDSQSSGRHYKAENQAIPISSRHEILEPAMRLTFAVGAET